MEGQGACDLATGGAQPHRGKSRRGQSPTGFARQHVLTAARGGEADGGGGGRGFGGAPVSPFRVTREREPEDLFHQIAMSCHALPF